MFGFNGWSSSIQNIQIDFVDENAQTGKISLGLSVIVRVTLKDGTHHEDIGYGQVENAKGKAAAFEKAKKEGTTDALKRAMRNFGNLLGNCVYDKSYLAKVSKLKVPATKWDADNLHRHPDFAPKKQDDEAKRNPSGLSRAASASAEFDDTFDFPDFEVEDFDAIDMAQQDEVAMPSEPVDTARRPGNGGSEGMPPPTRADLTTPSKPPAPVPRPVVTRSANGSSTNIIPQPLPGQRPQAMPAQPVRPLAGSDPRAAVEQWTRPSSPNVASDHFAQQPGGQAAPGQPFRAGFYSAKAAGNIDANNNVIPTAAAAAPKFNPHAESPSIRKTSGVDHNKSAPLKRDLKPDTNPLPTNVINPQLDQTRRVGAPGPNVQFASIRGPSTSAYRPPTRRGPEPAAIHTTNQPEQGAAKRTPLGDVSNMQHSVTATTPDGADAKRQKILDSGQDSVNGVSSENKPGA